MNNAKRNTALLCTAIGITAVAGFLISCATIDHVVVAPPMIPGAKYVGDDSCATCHEKVVAKFKMTQHARIPLRAAADQAEKGVDRIGCEACHGAGSLHVEAGGGKGKFVVNPGKNPQACMQCHLDIKAQFHLPYKHPVLEGKMSCNDCHDPHGDDVRKPKDLLFARTNAICAKCHREQARPKVYEHLALREGCVACHQVHGSINDKMLTERDGNLCLKCHSVANGAAGEIQTALGENHRSDVVRGACVSCHNNVHGSNLDPAFRY